MLNAIREVSASRLDIVKLDDLHKLGENGSNERLEAVVRKLELAKAMEVR